MTPEQHSMRVKSPRNDSKSGVVSNTYRDNYDDIFGTHKSNTSTEVNTTEVREQVKHGTNNNSEQP